MKILGWILTVLGSMLCLGALIEFANGELVVDEDGIVFLVIGISVALLVIGLMILNHKKK